MCTVALNKNTARFRQKLACRLQLISAVSVFFVRILILDWDIHHGNGIQNCFNDDPS